VKDREVKQYLLMGGERTLSGALNQIFKLEAVKANHRRGWEWQGLDPTSEQRRQGPIAAGLGDT
jgi:hypothetical protein